MSRKTFVVLIILVGIVNLTGLFSDIFTADSSLYATISKSLSQSGDYLNIYVQGQDWLDKPHFPFWICALSIKAFGVNTFAYKFPSILFFFIGLVYTYKLAKLLYNKETAYLATLILGSSIHIIVSNNDIRAEAILLCLVVAAVCHMYKLTLKFTIRDIIFTSLYCAAAIMTKGIFVLIIVYSAIFGNLIFRKEFKKLFNYKWIIVFVLTFILIIPELYSLYIQFDLHPEKVVFNRTGVSGIKFFLWDCQFGRFFNTGPIKGTGNITFFLGTMMWAFAPWAIVGFSSLFIFGKNMLKNINSKEFVTFFGFTIMFIVFSVSKFQLPHYLNILYPFLAILLAHQFTIYKGERKFDLIAKISINIYAVFYLLVMILLGYFFRPDLIYIGIFLSSCLLLLIVLFNSSNITLKYKSIIYGVLSTVLFGLFLNLNFYPTLLKYQAGAKSALYINKEYPEFRVIATGLDDWLLDYYLKSKLIRVEGINKVKEYTSDRNVLIYTDESFLKSMKETGVNYSVLKTFDYFHITRLNKTFINRSTREKAIGKRFLVKIESVN
jgi:4-amino-4-deoxy-L-arabinose transferase-like glycosyltransferase